MFACSICLLHYQVTSATETLSKFTMFDCGSAQISQPLVQQYSLNTPDQCSNLSTVYFPPLPHQSIQVLQIPSYTPIIVHNCLIQIKTRLLWKLRICPHGTRHADPRTKGPLPLFPGVSPCGEERRDAVLYTSFWIRKVRQTYSPTCSGACNLRGISCRVFHNHV